MGPLEVFSTAAFILNQRNEAHKGYKAVFSAERPGPVRMNSGLQLHADLAIDDGNSPDIILIPGGTDSEQVTRNRELIHRIRSKACKAEQIVSVCGGAFINEGYLSDLKRLDGMRKEGSLKKEDDLVQKNIQVAEFNGP